MAITDMLPGRAQPETGKITAGKIRELYEQGTTAIRFEQREQWLNRSFLAGEQWVYWSKETNRLEAAPRDPTRVRLVVDHLLSTSNTIIAKLLRRPLVFEVPPSASDDASVGGARIAAGVLASYHRDQNWEGLREEAAWATWQGGTGVLCLEWDARAGTKLKTTDDGKTVGTGEICASALSISEVCTEPGARDIEKARWWIKASALPADTVKEMYGLAKKPLADASPGLSPLQQELLRQDGRETPRNLTLVLTYFERPSSEGPGQVATVVGNELVGGGVKAWPFPFKDRLNVVAMRQTRVLARWTGETVLSRARSPQTALNQSWSSLVEHQKLCGNARLMVPQGSLEDAATLTDEPGEVIDYYAQAGGAPGYLSPPNLPAWQVEQPGMLKAEIDDILGVHDVSRGGAPAGVEAASALMLLSEQDDTPVGRFANEMANAWGRFATMVLQTCAAKCDTPRTARVNAAGGRMRPETIRWKGANLAGQTNAEVPLEAVQPRSRAAQYQLAMQLKGTFPDMTLSQFSQVADLPGGASLIEAVEPDADRARRENHEMGLGIVAIPETFDNHAEHIAEHNRFRKSAKYEQLDPELRAMIDQHVQAHDTMAAQEQGEQLARGMVSPALAGAAQAGEPPLSGEPLQLPPEATAPLPSQSPGQSQPAEQAAMPDQPTAGTQA